MGISYRILYYFVLEHLINTEKSFFGNNKNLIHSFFSTPSSLAYPPQQTFIPSSQSILNDVIDAPSWNEFWAWNLTVVEKRYVPLMLYALSLFWHLSKRYVNPSFVQNTIEWFQNYDHLTSICRYIFSKLFRRNEFTHFLFIAFFVCIWRQWLG